MDVTLRDIADFYRIALQSSDTTRQLVRVADVVLWVDDLIAKSDLPDEWMLDLSVAKTRDGAITALCRVPPPATEYVGVSLFVAHVNRLWSAGRLSRDETCQLLREVSLDLRPEHEIKAIVPECTLEDVEAVFSQGIRDGPIPFTRVDESLIEFFGLYEEFGSLTPTVSEMPSR